jgi:hypothetical protein
MIYLNFKYEGVITTIAQFKSREVAQEEKGEYDRFYGRAGYLYLSSRPTKAWENKRKIGRRGRR